MEPMKDDQRLLRWQKRQLALALVVTCLLAALWVSLAWLNHTRSLVTATEVHVPTLWIDKVHGTNAMNLGEIDVQDVEEYTTDESGVPKPCRRYVFSVKSNDNQPFRLQLAYTTNIRFTYKIYPAKEDTSGVKVETDDLTYYYACGSAMDYDMWMQAHDQTYLTTSVDDQGNASDTVYDETLVHPAAEPWYWISKAQTLDSGDETEGIYVVDPSEDDLYYTRYYVLEISWSSSETNSKETDMVYLMAENVG